MAQVRAEGAITPPPTARLPARVPVILGLAGLFACFGLFVDHRPLDLDVYRTAGRALWHGYDLYGPRVHVRQYGFTYPPFAALLFAVPALLPFAAAEAVLTIASLLSLRVVIRLSAPYLLRAMRTNGLALLAVAALIVCEPVRATLWDGQINLVLGAMVLWDLLANPVERSRGVLVGLAAAIKLTPAIFVLYLLMQRRFRTAATAVAAFAAATTLAWLVLPGDSHRFWFHDLLRGSGIGDESKSSNLYGAFLRAAGRTPATALWLACAIPTLIVGLTLARRVAEGGRPAVALGIVGITGCLVSPVTWTHHWVWCIPWLVGVGAACLERGRVGRWWLALLAVVFLGLNLVPPSVTARSPVSHAISANALAAAALLTALGAWLIRRPTRTQQALRT